MTPKKLYFFAYEQKQYTEFYAVCKSVEIFGKNALRNSYLLKTLKVSSIDENNSNSAH